MGIVERRQGTHRRAMPRDLSRPMPTVTRVGGFGDAGQQSFTCVMVLPLATSHTGAASDVDPSNTPAHFWTILGFSRESVEAQIPLPGRRILSEALPNLVAERVLREEHQVEHYDVRGVYDRDGSGSLRRVAQRRHSIAQ